MGSLFIGGLCLEERFRLLWSRCQLTYHNSVIQTVTHPEEIDTMEKIVIYEKSQHENIVNERDKEGAPNSLEIRHNQLKGKHIKRTTLILGFLTLIIFIFS